MALDKDKSGKRPAQPPPPDPPVEHYSGVSDSDWEAARKRAVSDLKKEQQYRD